MLTFEAPASKEFSTSSLTILWMEVMTWEQDNKRTVSLWSCAIPPLIFTYFPRIWRDGGKFKKRNLFIAHWRLRMAKNSSLSRGCFLYNPKSTTSTSAGLYHVSSKPTLASSLAFSGFRMKLPLEDEPLAQKRWQLFNSCWHQAEREINVI